jgi:hypothetical protein
MFYLRKIAIIMKVPSAPLKNGTAPYPAFNLGNLT